MKAVALTRYLPIADPESLVDVTLPDPKPAGHDILVKVEAVSVNPVDTKQRAPNPKVETAPRVLGYDAAGTVAAVGPEVTLFKPGDEVYYAGDVTRPGSNSELQLVDERIVGRKPKSLDFAQAAAIPLTAITAWEAYFDRMKIDAGGKHRGASLLIIGGAGGVGSIGIQIAKVVAGLKVIATASRPETIAWVKELGADHVVDHSQPLRPQLEALGLKNVDYIANFNDTDRYWDQMGDLVAPQGAVCMIVAPKGPLVAGRGARQERERLLGADVHPAALQDARHDRAAPPAHARGRADRRQEDPRHDARDAPPDQRGEHARRAREARVGDDDREARRRRLAVTPP